MQGTACPQPAKKVETKHEFSSFRVAGVWGIVMRDVEYQRGGQNPSLSCAQGKTGGNAGGPLGG
jgi:hypothetical protein